MALSESMLESCSTVFQKDGVIGWFSPEKPDLILYSLDQVAFYVHRFVLAKANAGFFPPDHIPTAADGEPTNNVSETAEVLNVILHALYSMPCVQFIPSLPTLERALERMKAHGMDIQSYTHPSSSLYTALFMHASQDPVSLYTLAGYFDLEDLAMAVSPHLLSLDLHSLTEAESVRMGPIYMRRLFMLHIHRREALKNIVFSPLSIHENASQCSAHGQGEAQSAWARSAADLAWDFKAQALPPSIIASSFEKTAEALMCLECRRYLQTHIRHVVVEWSKVKHTI